MESLKTVDDSDDDEEEMPIQKIKIEAEEDTEKGRSVKAKGEKGKAMKIQEEDDEALKVIKVNKGKNVEKKLIGKKEKPTKVIDDDTVYLEDVHTRQ